MSTRESRYNGELMLKGRAGEGEVTGWLRGCGCTVESVADRPEYQSNEIDLLVTMPTGALVTAEVKSWRGAGENFLFEIARVNFTATGAVANVLGWSCRSEADVLMWWNPETRTVYVMRMADYRRGWQAYVASGTQARPRWILTDDVKATVICDVPRRYFPQVWEYPLG